MWSVKSQIVKEANPFLFGNENLPLPNITKPRITARLLMWSVKSQIMKEANPFLFGNEKTHRFRMQQSPALLRGS